MKELNEEEVEKLEKTIVEASALAARDGVIRSMNHFGDQEPFNQLCCTIDLIAVNMGLWHSLYKAVIFTADEASKIMESTDWTNVEQAEAASVALEKLSRANRFLTSTETNGSDFRMCEKIMNRLSELKSSIRPITKQ